MNKEIKKSEALEASKPPTINTFKLVVKYVVFIILVLYFGSVGLFALAQATSSLQLISAVLFYGLILFAIIWQFRKEISGYK